VKHRQRISNISDTDSSEDNFRPQLTSLIDVMTILLVFLIKSFSVEGNLIVSEPSVKLPVSTIREKAKPIFRISINENELLIDGERVLLLSSLDNSDNLMIKPLFDKVNIIDKAVKGEVMLEADRELDFYILKKVMFTCSKAGFSNFSVLVIREEV
jgi:biopolymer transport protein ExbD